LNTEFCSTVLTRVKFILSNSLGIHFAFLLQMPSIGIMVKRPPSFLHPIRAFDEWPAGKETLGKNFHKGQLDVA
jgi:hypothetical protein